MFPILATTKIVSFAIFKFFFFVENQGAHAPDRRWQNVGAVVDLGRGGPRDCKRKI